MLFDIRKARHLGKKKQTPMDKALMHLKPERRPYHIPPTTLGSSTAVLYTQADTRQPWHTSVSTPMVSVQRAAHAALLGIRAQWIFELSGGGVDRAPAKAVLVGSGPGAQLTGTGNQSL